jgi:hypothetical protein
MDNTANWLVSGVASLIPNVLPTATAHADCSSWRSPAGQCALVCCISGSSSFCFWECFA